MNKNYLAVVIAALTFSLAACDAKSDAKKTDEKPVAQQAVNEAKTQMTDQSNTANEMNDISYAIGFTFGKNIKSTGITTIDKDQMLQGFSAALEGKESRLSQEQFQAAMTALQSDIQKNAEKKIEENVALGKKLLEDNAKRSGVVTTKSGLQYEVVQQGKGVSPKETDIVKVNYEGKLADGTVFDSSIKRGEPVEFPVNAVIPGWQEALKLMKVGEKVKLYIPSDLAYGATGFQNVIPPNAVLVFDVELLDIKKPEAAPAKGAPKK